MTTKFVNGVQVGAPQSDSFDGTGTIIGGALASLAGSLYGELGGKLPEVGFVAQAASSALLSALRPQFFCLAFLGAAVILCGLSGGDALGAPNETNSDAPPGGYVFNKDPVYVKISSSVFRLESSYIFPMYNSSIINNSSKERPKSLDTLTLHAVLPFIDHINKENAVCFKILCNEFIRIKLQNSPNALSPKTFLERMLGGEDDVVEDDNGLERHVRIGNSDVSYYTYSDDAGIIHLMYCGALECGASIHHNGGALVFYYFYSSQKYKWKEIDRKVSEWLDNISVR